MTERERAKVLGISLRRGGKYRPQSKNRRIRRSEKNRERAEHLREIAASLPISKAARRRNLLAKADAWAEEAEAVLVFRRKRESGRVSGAPLWSLPGNGCPVVRAWLDELNDYARSVGVDERHM